MNILFHGLQRSGTHAIMVWVGNQLLQDAKWKGVLLYANDLLYLLAQDKSEPVFLEPIRRNPPTHIIANVEDEFFWAGQTKMQWISSGMVEIPEFDNVVLVIRSPWNLLASRFSYKEECRLGNSTRQSMIAWKEHASSAIELIKNVNENSLVLLYDKWVESREYRSLLLSQLGIDFVQDDMDSVPDFGGGSSFDGTRVPGSQMKVLERWRLLPDSIVTRTFDQDLLELARTLGFNPPAEIERLIQ